MLDFNVSTHTYSRNGKIIPSVTQVLKSAGLIEVSPYAYTSTGTVVHEACQAINEGTGDIPIIPQSAVNRVRQYLDFIKMSGFVPDSVEKRVYHQELNYCGTYDITGHLNGKYVLIDIKTGAAIDWHKIQLVAYRDAIRQTGDRVPKKIYSLYLPLTGRYRLIEVKPMEILYYMGQFKLALKQFKETK